MQTIFDKFVQSSKTKTEAGGTGLGLSICRELVIAHNGRIWAENNPQGGAMFTFELPLLEEDQVQSVPSVFEPAGYEAKQNGDATHLTMESIQKGQEYAPSK